MKKEKTPTWRLIYPDKTESLMNYDPIEKIKKEVKGHEKRESKIRELHNLVVTGLVKGLSHTSRDGRLNDINFWRKRCNLFNEFSKAVLDIVTEQNSEYAEKNLKEIAEEGYKMEDSD